jgi:hypothetical protein
MENKNKGHQSGKIRWRHYMEKLEKGVSKQETSCRRTFHGTTFLRVSLPNSFETKV